MHNVKKPSAIPFQKLVEFHKAVGDATRLQLLWTLNNTELCVKELAALIGMSKSAVSHQLKELKTAKLVKIRRQGKYSYYSLNDENIQATLRETKNLLVRDG